MADDLLFGPIPPIEGPPVRAFCLTVEILGKFQLWSSPMAWPCFSYSILLMPAMLPEVDFRPYFGPPYELEPPNLSPNS